MRKRVAILTPDAGSEEFQGRWVKVLERYAELLRHHGLAVEPRTWTSGDALREFDLVLPLLVWGYPMAPERWLACVERWAGEGVRLQNPATVLRWNADKSYLGELARRGAPVVPTRYAERLTLEGLEASAEAFGTDQLVAKPRISSSGWQTIRWSPGASLEGGPEGAAMIQPYLPDIASGGEVSLFYFSGRYSHAVSKRPQPGEFRVQPEFDGIIRTHDAIAEEKAAAEQVLRVVEEELLYARVDLVRGLTGEPQLIELELIEPDLYLGYDVGEGTAFASAVKELIAR